MKGHPIYDYMKKEGLTDLDEKSFLSAYSTPEKAKEIYDYMKSEDLTDISQDEFYSSYFKKKSSNSEASQSVTPSNPENGGGSVSENVDPNAIAPNQEPLNTEGLVGEDAPDAVLSAPDYKLGDAPTVAETLLDAGELDLETRKNKAIDNAISTIENQKEKAKKSGMDLKEYRGILKDKYSKKYLSEDMQEDYSLASELEFVQKQLGKYTEGPEFDIYTSKEKTLTKQIAERRLDAVQKVNDQIKSLKSELVDASDSEATQIAEDVQKLLASIKPVVNPMEVAKTYSEKEEVKRMPGDTRLEKLENYYHSRVEQLEDMESKMDNFSIIRANLPVYGYLSGEAEVWQDMQNRNLELKELAPVMLLNKKQLSEDNWLSQFGKGVSNVVLGDTQYPTEQKQASTLYESFEMADVSDGVDEDFSKAMEASYDMSLGEEVSYTVGTTVGLMPYFMGGGAIVKGAGGLVRATKVGKYINTAKNINRSTKLLYGAAESGLQYEAAGLLGNSETLQDEATFLSGALGSVFASGAKGVGTSLAGKKFYQSSMTKMFGSNAATGDKLMGKLFAKSGLGLGEVAEEYGNEIASILKDSGSDMEKFIELHQDRFGTAEGNIKFGLMTFFMGAAMGSATNAGKKFMAEHQSWLKNQSPEVQKEFEAISKEVSEDISSAAEAIESNPNQEAKSEESETLKAGDTVELSTEVTENGEGETKSEEVGDTNVDAGEGETSNEDGPGELKTESTPAEVEKVDVKELSSEELETRKDTPLIVGEDVDWDDFLSQQAEDEMGSRYVKEKDKNVFFNPLSKDYTENTFEGSNGYSASIKDGNIDVLNKKRKPVSNATKVKVLTERAVAQSRSKMIGTSDLNDGSGSVAEYNERVASSSKNPIEIITAIDSVLSDSTDEQMLQEMSTDIFGSISKSLGSKAISIDSFMKHTGYKKSDITPKMRKAFNLQNKGVSIEAFAEAASSDSEIESYYTDSAISADNVIEFMTSFESSKDYEATLNRDDEIIGLLKERFREVTGLTPTNRNFERVYEETIKSRPAREIREVKAETVNEPKKSDDNVKPESKPEPKKSKPKYGSSNKGVTVDKFESAKEAFKKGTNNLNSGLDADLLKAATTMAAFHIEAGTRKLADVSAKLIEDAGEAIIPYIEEAFNAANKNSAKEPVSPSDKKSGNTKETNDAISLKKSSIEDTRERYNLDRLPPPLRKAWQKSYDNAIKNGAHKKEVVNQTVVKALSGESITEEEHIGLVVRETELENQIEAEQDVLEKTNNLETLSEVNDRISNLIDEISIITKAAQQAGTEAARRLNIRRLAISKNNFSIAKLTKMVEKAKADQPLTDAEKAKVADMAKKIKEQQKRIESLEKQAEELEAQRLKNSAEKQIQEEIKSIKRVAKKGFDKKDRQQRKKKAVDSIKDIMSRLNDVTSVVETIAPLYELAKVNIEDGVDNLADLYTKMKEDVPDLTERDVIVALTTNTQENQRSAVSDSKKRLNELKKQAKIKRKIEDIAKGIRKPKTPKNNPSKEVKALNEALKKLTLSINNKKKLDEALNILSDIDKELYDPATDIELTKEKIRDLLALVEVEKTIEDIESDIEGLKSKDPDVKKEATDNILKRSEVKVKQTTEFNDRLNKARAKKAKLQQNALDYVKHKHKKTSTQIASDIWNVTRTMKATADLSGTLRQGAFAMLLTGRFDFFVKALVNVNSEKTEAIYQGMINETNHTYREMAGLELTHPGTSQSEEFFQSDWAKKIPGLRLVVKGSENHMSTVLNLLRVEMFDTYLTKHYKTGDVDIKDLTEFARWVNIATGRGQNKVDADSKFGHLINNSSEILFAPKYTVSRFQALNAPLRAGRRLVTGKSSKADKEIMKQWIRLAGTYAVIKAAMSYLLGGDEEEDPRDSDFMKNVINNTRYDVLAGEAQVLRILSQTVFKVLESYEVVDKTNDPNFYGYNQSSLPALWGKFIQYKLHPSISAGLMFAQKKDAIGKPFMAYDFSEKYKTDIGIDTYGSILNAGEAFTAVAIPIVIEEIYGEYKMAFDGELKHPSVGQATVNSVATILGMGTSTYDSPKRSVEGKKYYSEVKYSPKGVTSSIPKWLKNNKYLKGVFESQFQIKYGEWLENQSYWTEFQENGYLSETEKGRALRSMKREAKRLRLDVAEEMEVNYNHLGGGAKEDD